MLNCGKIAWHVSNDVTPSGAEVPMAHVTSAKCPSSDMPPPQVTKG